jgi:hypothetical protein
MHAGFILAKRIRELAVTVKDCTGNNPGVKKMPA